jgi:hypothetical protein
MAPQWHRSTRDDRASARAILAASDRMGSVHVDRAMTALVRHESEFLLYAAQNGAVKVRVLFRDETAWLTQRALAELFGVQPLQSPST